MLRLHRVIALLAAGLFAAGCSKDAPPAPPAAASATAASAEPTSAPEVTATASAPAAPVTGLPVREIAGAAHILVIYKGAEGAPKAITRTKEAAKARAEEALKKIKDKRATFEEAVKAYNDDPASKATNGAIGNFERNVMPPSFSKVVFDMKVDEISDVVVETPRGFHVIKRTR